MMNHSRFSVILNLTFTHLIIVPDRKEEWDNMYYIAWVDIIMGGIKGLQFYNPEQNVWGQAHVLASFAILSVIREGDPSLITFDFTKKDDKDYFYVNIDRAKLRTSGFNALKEFLRKLHIYKVRYKIGINLHL
jgi:dipeptidyl-peptidase-3